VPDLPWTSRTTMEPDTQYVVMASHLPLKKLSHTIGLFRAVSAVRKQLGTAPGLVGYSLRAKPLRRDYWTLSVWADQAALRTFMRTPPHAQLMSSLKPMMGPTTFVQWEVAGTEGRPTWTTAIGRLAGG
jgi:quinol monooxygenase YgiN